MTSPRPYVAAAAAAALAALFFVPSASASPDDAPASAKTGTAAHASTNTLTVQHTTSTKTAQQVGLADTGSIDTTPYLVGGAAFLVAGAGLIVNAGRRTRRSTDLGF